jgi:hypothetical protein
MAFGQDFLKGFGEGFFGADGLKDYAHASKTFRTNGYEFAPKQKFLFHVYFTVNTANPAIRSAFDNRDIATIGLMVKNVQLPNYTLSVDTMNQYNRKRLVQTKIDYNPVSMEFHDDGGDLVRNMWYNYFSYYYKDPNQKYDNVTNTNGSLGALIGTPAGFNYNSRDIYDNSRQVNDWGYIGESYNDGNFSAGSTVGPSGKVPFFRDIRIYGFDQHKISEYILINPMITEWQHDTYDYAQGNGIMSHRMTIRYETVKYYSGAIGRARPDTNAVGFADPAYYDTIRSSISRVGANQTVLGQGGLIDAGVGIIEDLSSGSVAGLLGAVQKAGTAYNTFKDKNIRSIVNRDLVTSRDAVLRNSLPGAVRGVIGQPNTPGASAAGIVNPALQQGALGGIFFPTPPRSTPATPGPSSNTTGNP